MKERATSPYITFRFHGSNPAVTHCEDAPAIVDTEGNEEWYLNGKRIEEFCDTNNIPYKYVEWPNKYKILWKLSL